MISRVEVLVTVANVSAARYLAGIAWARCICAGGEDEGGDESGGDEEAAADH